jgi:hypothetical protein
MIKLSPSSFFLVGIHKRQKIDLREMYPCPCCRGRLEQIVLTEALGCDQCQKIFALQNDGYGVEQTSSPYHSCWQWDGKKWRAPTSSTGSNWILVSGLTITAAVAIGSWQVMVMTAGDRTPGTEQKSKKY